MNYKIGQKVVCIDNRKRELSIGKLKKNEIYTIVGFNEYDNGLVLKECKSPDSYKGSYLIERFKPLKYDIIDNMNIINEMVEEKADIKIKEHEIINL